MKIISQFNSVLPVPAGNLLLVLVFGLLTSKSHQLVADALRMNNLDAPIAASQGDTIQLSCFYSLGSLENVDKTASNHQNSDLKLESGKSKHQAARKQILTHIDQRAASSLDSSSPSSQSEVLYAVRWYKDGSEFYRYLAQSYDHKQAFNMEGLIVDVENSDNHTVSLKNITLKTSGLFKCEVATDAPSFTTKSIERRMLVHSPPSEGPIIKIANLLSSTFVLGHNKELVYSLGDSIKLTCTTFESKPAASIDWIINGTLNLTSARPLSGQQRPLFYVETSRTVKLPMTANATGQYKAFGQASLGHSVNAQTFKYGNTSTSTIDPPFIPGVSPPINLAHALDQLLESTTSQLNFTVDSEFFEALSRYTNSKQKSPPTGQTNSLTTSDKPELSTLDSVVSVRLRTNRGTNLTARKPRKRLLLATNNDELRLDIRCVARVLHLVMSDEIKLRSGDKSRILMNREIGKQVDGKSTKQLWLVRSNSSDPRCGCSLRITLLILLPTWVLILAHIKALHTLDLY